MADNDDQFRGETLDLLLEFMDEDFLDEALQEDLSVAVTEITEATGRFVCGNCEKVYKTKGGLGRHQNAKHQEEGESITAKKCEIDEATI